MKKSLCINTK